MRGDSRDLIVRAAERLFGERGIQAVSMREVAAASGQHNNSAVQYHFRSKDGLVDAIFRFRMASIDERRRAMLARLDAAGRPVALRGLLEALVYPLAEAIGHDDGTSWYARFLRQVLIDPDFDAFAPSRRDVTRGLRTVIDRLEAHLRPLPAAVRAERLALAVKLIVNALADHEALLASSRALSPTSLLTSDLVDVAAAVLTAPVSDDTTREIRHLSSRGA
jgi:AcrR family transcriptional regulator